MNHLVAAAAMSMLLFPDMTKLIGEGASLFSFPITNVNYTSQVFPSILGVIFYAFMERFFTKISPKPIRVFFIPMMSLLFTVPMTLLVFEPIGFEAGTLLTNVILFLFDKAGWMAVETIPIRHGMIGQETNGAGGMFKAFRTIPVILDIVEDMKELCPHAWLINFTNPAGMVTEAVFRYGQLEKVIGL